MLEPLVVPERRVSDPVKSVSRRHPNLASGIGQWAALVPPTGCQEQPIAAEQSMKRPIKRKNATVEQRHLPSIARPIPVSQDKPMSVMQNQTTGTLPMETVQKHETTIRIIINAAENQAIQEEESKILKQLNKAPKQEDTTPNQEVARQKQEVHTQRQWTEMLVQEYKTSAQENDEQEQTRWSVKQDALARNQESQSPELRSSTLTPRPSVLTEFASTEDDQKSLSEEKVVLINQRTTYRPKYCWCLRCQIMFSLYKTGDRALEMWGNYPCFRR